MPVIIAGADAEISQEVQTTGNKGFYRLCYTDQVPGAGETLETADFDQDGLSNINEIRPPNGLATHPLNPDTDADGLKDGWEVSHAFNPHDSSDAAGDKDSDGLTNLQEYQWGANPTNPDTDGDGAMDGDEKDGNTNPKDPGSAPQEGWIVLTGDHAKGERKALKRTVTIPKGQTRLVMVVLHSDEYPEYTEYDSEFDDVLEWKITPTAGTAIAGQTNVNDKHADWQLADAEGTTIKNFYPVHIEKVSSLTAPPEKDLTVTLELAATNISDDEKPSTVMVGLLPVEVVPDYNRDGMINDEDRGNITSEKPFVFWANDDDDGNEEPHFGDIPGSQIDGADMLVNHPRDLLDFFPVTLHLKEVLATLPADKYTYKISHPTGAFHFIEMPDVHPDSSPKAQGAGSYLQNPTMAEDAMARPMSDTAGKGAELSAEYLGAVKNGMGVLLFEAKSATNQSFELIVSEKGKGGEVARIVRALPVEMVESPESLYWHVNIREVVKGKAPGDVQEPICKWFKESRKDQWFVFCHGYNVNTEAARGWNSEVFKRLYHKGCNARFLGVSWEGSQGQLGGDITFGEVFTPDYWRNAYNAFASSHALANIVNKLPGNTKSKTIIAGHSMGNIIVSSAICDHGLQAEHYFLLNAAVAREAYSPSHVESDRNGVCHPNWASYPSRLWSSDWFTLFPNDARKNLTWQGRFGNIATKTQPHNYYSSTEDVLDNGTGSVPDILDLALKDTGAWIKQEMSKGLATKAFVTGAGSGNWTSQGGWAFNPNYYLKYRLDPLDSASGKLPDTGAISNNQLRKNPFFKPFTKLSLVNGGAVPDSSAGIDLSSATGANHASKYAIRAWLLCHDIPAVSNPTGKNSVFSTQQAPKQDTDMNGLKSGNWGAWKHSDLKNAPMDVVGTVFEKMVERGKLK
jgi:hypothetical protein